MLEFDDQPQPFKVTAGFVAFVAAFFLPVVVAAGVYLGAWLVADEVRAAEARSEQAAGFNVQRDDGSVAGWKKALVGVCPLH